MQPIIHINIAGNTRNQPVYCTSLTAYAKYLQLAYSGAGNLRDFTYNLRVNVLLIVQVKHTHCMQPIIHIDIACNTRNMLIHCLQFDCIGRIPTTCPHGTGNVQAFTYTLPALCMHFAYTLHLNICSAMRQMVDAIVHHRNFPQQLKQIPSTDLIITSSVETHIVKNLCNYNLL